MADRLRTLALKPKRMIVMGAPLPVSISTVLICGVGPSGAATLAGPDRAWLPLDFDDVRSRKGLASGERLTEAALFVRDLFCRMSFMALRMIVVPSASTGRKAITSRGFGSLPCSLRRIAPGDEELGEGRGGDARSADRLRDHPSGTADLYRAPVDLLKADGGRILSRGRCTRRSSTAIAILWRWLSTVRAKTCSERSQDRSRHPRLRPNWRAFLDATVGDDERFLRFRLREESASRCEQARTLTRSKPRSRRCWRLRADPGRQAQYGRSWVMRTIESFRLRDDATRAAHKRALSRLFIEETRAP